MGKNEEWWKEYVALGTTYQDWQNHSRGRGETKNGRGKLEIMKGSRLTSGWDRMQFQALERISCSRSVRESLSVLPDRELPLVSGEGDMLIDFNGYFGEWYCEG